LAGASLDDVSIAELGDAVLGVTEFEESLFDVLTNFGDGSLDVARGVA
jgi:hypothetical protein